MSEEKKIKRFPLTSNPRPSDKEPVKRPLPPRKSEKLKYTISCRNCSGNFVICVPSKDMFAWVKLEKDIDEAFTNLTEQEKTMLSVQLCTKCLEKF